VGGSGAVWAVLRGGVGGGGTPGGGGTKRDEETQRDRETAKMEKRGAGREHVLELGEHVLEMGELSTLVFLELSHLAGRLGLFRLLHICRHRASGVQSTYTYLCIYIKAV